jgi:Uma2 family endonuclease
VVASIPTVSVADDAGTVSHMFGPTSTGSRSASPRSVSDVQQVGCSEGSMILRRRRSSRREAADTVKSQALESPSRDALVRAHASRINRRLRVRDERYPQPVNEVLSPKATYQDVLDAPEHMVAEVLGGVLHLSPRPAPPHANAATQLISQIHPPFARGKAGPGGWIILIEPEIHLHDDIVVPDIAGWRRTTMDRTGDELAYFDIRPDWICEVLSPSTAKIDRTLKLAIYAREGVQHAWLVDPRSYTLEVLRCESGTCRHAPPDLKWVTVGVFSEDDRIHAEPFDAIELDLAELWADV